MNQLINSKSHNISIHQFFDLNMFGLQSVTKLLRPLITIHGSPSGTKRIIESSRQVSGFGSCSKKPFSDFPRASTKEGKWTQEELEGRQSYSQSKPKTTDKGEYKYVSELTFPFQLPPDDFYEIIEKRCIKVIYSTIEKKQKGVQIILKKILEPYQQYSVKKVQSVYDRCIDYFWNNHGVGIDIKQHLIPCYGKEGPNVSIYYTLDKPSESGDKSDELKTKEKINKHVDKILPLILKRMDTMKSGDSQLLEVNLGFEEYLYDYYYREISDRLERMNIGKVIKSHAFPYIFKF